MKILVVEDNALAIGTHGRSFYVMDDIAALRQFGLAPLTDVAVCSPRTRVLSSLELARPPSTEAAT